MAEKATIKINLDASLAGKSLNKINKELDEMNKELKTLEVGSKEFIDTSKKINKTTKSLDEFNQALKETDDEVKDMSLIDKFADAPGVLGAVTQSVQGLGEGFKALLANPIGILLTVIAVAGKAIYDAFASTEEGANALSEAFAFMEGLLNPLKQILISIGEFLYSLFTDPLESLLNFSDAIQTYVIDLFDTVLEGLGFLGDAIMKVFEGDFSGALESAEKGLMKFQEAAIDAVAPAVKAISELVDEGLRQAELFQELEKRQNNLNKAVRAAEVLNAQAIADIEELKLVRDDETKSIQERQKANDAIFAIEQQRNTRNIKNAEEQVSIIQAELALKKNDGELLKALAEAEIELADKRSESAGIRAEQLASNLGLLRDEANLLNDLIDKEEERTLIFIESETEKLAIQKKNQQERLKNIEKTLGKESIEYKEAANQVQVIEANLTKAVIDEQIERNDKSLETTEQGINNKFDILESATDDELELIELASKREEELLKSELTNLEANYIEQQKLAGDNQAELLRIKEQYESDVLAVEDDAEAKRKIRDNETLKAQEDLNKAKLEQTIAFTQSAGQALNDLIAGNIDSLGDALTASIDSLFNEENGILVKLEKGTLGVAEKAAIAQEALGAAIAGVNALVSQSTDKLISENEESFNKKSEALKASLENDEISQEEFNTKSQQLEKQKLAKEKKLKQKAFNTQKAIDISSAVANTALAAIKAFATVGPVLGPIAAAAVSAVGAIQIGVIAAQKPKFKDGGFVQGSGTGTSDSIDAMLSNGEFVINAQSTAAFKPMLEAINGNRTGELVPSVDEELITSTNNVFVENEKKSTVKAVVVETDITNTQNRVSRIEENSSF